jgi:hypothetical protein
MIHLKAMLGTLSSDEYLSSEIAFYAMDLVISMFVQVPHWGQCLILSSAIINKFLSIVCRGQHVLSLPSYGYV